MFIYLIKVKYILYLDKYMDIEIKKNMVFKIIRENKIIIILNMYVYI